MAMWWPQGAPECLRATDIPWRAGCGPDQLIWDRGSALPKHRAEPGRCGLWRSCPRRFPLACWAHRAKRFHGAGAQRKPRPRAPALWGTAVRSAPRRFSRWAPMCCGVAVDVGPICSDRPDAFDANRPPAFGAAFDPVSRSFCVNQSRLINLAPGRTKIKPRPWRHSIVSGAYTSARPAAGELEANTRSNAFCRLPAPVRRCGGSRPFKAVCCGFRGGVHYRGPYRKQVTKEVGAEACLALWEQPHSR